MKTENKSVLTSDILKMLEFLLKNNYLNLTEMLNNSCQVQQLGQNVHLTFWLITLWYLSEVQGNEAVIVWGLDYTVLKEQFDHLNVQKNAEKYGKR